MAYNSSQKIEKHYSDSLAMACGNKQVILIVSDFFSVLLMCTPLAYCLICKYFGSTTAYTISYIL